jgi:hypothetical protein
MSPKSTTARDDGVKRVRRLTRYGVAGAAALTGLFSTVAAVSFSGHTHHRASSAAATVGTATVGTSSSDTASSDSSTSSTTSTTSTTTLKASSNPVSSSKSSASVTSGGS